MSAAPFRTPRLHIAQVIGPHEMLDAIAEAEGAALEARKMQARAAEIAAKFGAERGFTRMTLDVFQARTLAKRELGL